MPEPSEIVDLLERIRWTNIARLAVLALAAGALAHQAGSIAGGPPKPLPPDAGLRPLEDGDPSDLHPRAGDSPERRSASPGGAEVIREPRRLGRTPRARAADAVRTPSAHPPWRRAGARGVAVARRSLSVTPPPPPAAPPRSSPARPALPRTVPAPNPGRPPSEDEFGPG